MPAIHPAARTPVDQVKILFNKLVDRVRAVEVQMPRAYPLVVMATPSVTLTSATAVSLWTLLDSSPEEWTVTIQLSVALSTTATVGLLLLGSGGRRLDSVSTSANGPVTLTATGDRGPFVIKGYRTAGTVTVTLISAVATPWVVLNDDVDN